MKKLFTSFMLAAGMILGLSVNANAQQPVDVDGYNYVITSDKTVSVAQGGARYMRM